MEGVLDLIFQLLILDFYFVNFAVNTLLLLLLFVENLFIEGLGVSVEVGELGV